jgi:predicted O-methyltransferase YrrM
VSSAAVTSAQSPMPSASPPLPSAMDMTPQRWTDTGAYLRDVFGTQDDQLRTLMTRAVAAGLPDIAVSADVGRLVMILASMTPGDAAGMRTGIEVGTLGGYSGIWLARGLGQAGRLYTIEPVPLHADFAQREFDAAGLGSRVHLRRSTGLDELPKLAKELGPGSVDVLFFDAIKSEYPRYFEAGRSLIRRGGLLIADNALGAGHWWIDTPEGENSDRDGADTFNRMVAADPDFEAVAVPLREGVLIARRVK